MQISELIEDFDRRDYTREDSVLWYQSQLTEIYQPVGALEFDRPNRDVVLGMQEKYADLLLRETTAELVTQEQQEELAMRDKIEADRRKQFEQVQSMFLPTEATVYRQRENVLISAHGFQFPTGRSEFESENFAVANKVIQAIAIFPGSRIEITGHTDSTGGAETNRKLSKERAANVMKFLNEIGQIPMERLSSEGYGEDRPFASNKTEEGRAQNRRVDILIKND
jgi:outer membrane protein OmpA-like peptidoglycan-associated protein